MIKIEYVKYMLFPHVVHQNSKTPKRDIIISYIKDRKSYVSLENSFVIFS